jgi:hypothetical protein
VHDDEEIRALHLSIWKTSMTYILSPTIFSGGSFTLRRIIGDFDWLSCLHGRTRRNHNGSRLLHCGSFFRGGAFCRRCCSTRITHRRIVRSLDGKNLHVLNLALVHNVRRFFVGDVIIGYNDRARDVGRPCRRLNAIASSYRAVYNDD